MIPADGRILQGMASVDQQRLTGEAQIVEKSSGDTIFAATPLLSRQIWVQVEKAETQTLAAQIGELLEQTTEHICRSKRAGCVWPNLAQ